jgi:hypothetical protein
METWNREELYAAIWDQPASKVAANYGISDVMLGKVCRSLLIPVPGRGYWERKAAGRKLTQRNIRLRTASHLFNLRYRTTVFHAKKNGPATRPIVDSPMWCTVVKTNERAGADEAKKGCEE